MLKKEWVKEVVNKVMRAVFTGLNNAKYQRKLVQVSMQEYILAGFRYHRAEGVWPFLRVGEALRLKREPCNPYDSNAIAVYFKNDMLGFIPSNKNELLAQKMDQGELLEAVITQLQSDSERGRSVRLGVYSGSKRGIYPANTLHMQWK